MISYLLKKDWWKWMTVILLVYVVIGGFLFPVPKLPIVNETIRNTHFHVPMWFGMILIFTASMAYSIKYLSKGNLKDNMISAQLVNVGVLFGVLGMVTGMIWANYTWGEPWSNDPKQNSAAVALLIYLALIVLRGSISDDRVSARISSVYNIFAYSLMVPLLFILPRMTDSLHPGNGGNPGFNAYDLDNNLRLVFYPAVIGWTMLGFWLASISIRINQLELERDV